MTFHNTETNKKYVALLSICTYLTLPPSGGNMILNILHVCFKVQFAGVTNHWIVYVILYMTCIDDFCVVQ